MKTTPSVTKAPPVPGRPLAEKPTPRAQKRLVTQSEREAVAELLPPHTVTQPAETDRTGESR